VGITFNSLQAQGKAWAVQAKIAARNVIRHRRHTLLAFVAIVFGISGLLIALGFTQWGYTALRESFIRTQFGHIRITAKGYFDQGQVPVGKYLLPNTLQNADAIRTDPRIKSIFPRLSFTGLLSRGEKTVGFLGTGVDSKAEREAGMGFETTAGDTGKALVDGIEVGQGLASYLELKVGDRLTLTSNTRGGGVNAVELPVASIFSTGNRNYDDYNVRIPIEQARRLLRVQGVHNWVIMLHETEQTKNVQRDLEKHLPASQFDRVIWSTHAEYVTKMADLYDGFTAFMKAVVAIIIVLGIGNTLSMAVMERTGEIGTMLAMGADRRRILRNFIFEGISLALIGGLVGIIVAMLLAFIITAIGFQMPPPPGMSKDWTVEIHATPRVVWNTLVIAIPSIILASIIPAWRASSQKIVDALRAAR
jgi:putative ABC transport system permease protein